MTSDPARLAASIAPEAAAARRQDLLNQGLSPSTLRHARSARGWVTPYRGTYRLSGERGPLDDLWDAYVHMGPEALFVLTSAITLHGISGVVGAKVPELAMPPGLERRQRAALRIHFWEVPDAQRTVVDGLPVTKVARTLADAARLLPRMQSVSCLDSARHLGLVDEEVFDALPALMSRRPGAVSGRKRLVESLVGSQSPLETRVRLRASDGGFPPDALQVPIHDAEGRVLGFGDMGYEVADGGWLIVEADGKGVHELPDALLHDRRRQNAFLAHTGASIVRFTWQDTRYPTYIPGVLGPILGRAGWRPRRS